MVEAGSLFCHTQHIDMLRHFHIVFRHIPPEIPKKT